MSSDYPPDWDQRRQKVYERDNYTCQNCGAKGGPHGNAELHAHHIVPKSKGGTHEISNLKTICNECHSAIHNESVQAPTHPGLQTQNSVPGEFKFPLSKEDYSEEIHPKVERANVLYEINKEWNKAEDAYSRLKELYEIAISTKGKSNRLEREAKEAYGKVNDHLDEIDRLGGKLEEMDAEGIDKLDKKHGSNVHDELSKYLPLVRKNVDIIFEAVVEKKFDILTTAEYEFLKEDYENAMEDYNSAVEKYMDYLSRKFKEDQEPSTEDHLKNLLSPILAIGWLLFYGWVVLSFSSLLPKDIPQIAGIIILPIHFFLLFGMPYIIYKKEWL